MNIAFSQSRPIKFVNLVVPSPCETEPYSKIKYIFHLKRARARACARVDEALVISRSRFAEDGKEMQKDL